MNLNVKLKKIKMLLLDVDGVLTNGSIFIGNDNDEYIAFNILDGFGIKMIQNSGIDVGIITGRSSDAVKKRAADLKIVELYQGYLSKIQAYLQILRKNDLDDEEIAFIGDDLFDLPVMNRVGFSAAVANAREEVKTNADYVTKLSGGQGAVREVTDMILRSQNKWDSVLEKMISYDEK